MARRSASAIVAESERPQRSASVRRWALASVVSQMCLSGTTKTPRLKELQCFVCEVGGFTRGGGLFPGVEQVEGESDRWIALVECGVPAIIEVLSAVAAFEVWFGTVIFPSKRVLGQQSVSHGSLSLPTSDHVSRSRRCPTLPQRRPA